MNYLSKNLHWLLESGRLKVDKVSAALSIPSSSILKGDVKYVENWLHLSELSGFSLDVLAHTDLSAKFSSKRKGIKLLSLDVDGVLTEGGMFYSEDGTEFKRFHTRDGMGIRIAISAGIQVGFLSHGKNVNLITSRAEHLGVKHVYCGKESKLEILSRWASEDGITLDNCAHIGDDINDLEIMDKVGLSACPADAVDVVIKSAHVVLKSKGGTGCVREFVEQYLI